MNSQQSLCEAALTNKRLRTPQAAAFIGLSPATLEQDRTTGRLKIPFLKIGRAVVYDAAALEEWLKQHRCNNTSQYSTGV